MTQFDQFLPPVPFQAVGTALDTLIPVALSDTHQSGHCAAFLLAWWNGRDLGHFAICSLDIIDRELRQAMLVILSYIAQNGIWYADKWGRRKDIEDIFDLWVSDDIKRRMGGTD